MLLVITITSAPGKKHKYNFILCMYTHVARTLVLHITPRKIISTQLIFRGPNERVSNFFYHPNFKISKQLLMFTSFVIKILSPKYHQSFASAIDLNAIQRVSHFPKLYFCKLYY